MPSVQDFLASYSVKIDESGLNRLDGILDRNEQKARSVASAFSSARGAMQSWLETQGNASLPSAPGNEPNEQGRRSAEISASLSGISAALGRLTLPNALRNASSLKLTADTSPVLASARSALSAIQGLFSSASVTLPVRVTTDLSGLPASLLSGALGGLSGMRRSATGGRFSSATLTQVAEDGDPEYIIPIRKESIALPLLRSALSELSASARASLAPQSAAAPARVQRTLQAPVNIYVTSTAEPEEVAQGVLNAAERFLRRTLNSV